MKSKSRKETNSSKSGGKERDRKPPAQTRDKKPTVRRPVSSTANFQADKVLETVSDGIVAFDAEMNYIYVNPRGGEMLGRKPEDLIGRNYWTEYPEAKGTPFAEAYVRAFKTQQPIIFEDHFIPWDRWFENRIYPSRDGLTILFTEITEKKRAEQALQEAQKRLRLAVQSANMGLWDWDLVTNKVYYSPEWKGQLGYADHEISNDFSEWENRVHPDDLERAKSSVSRYIEKPDPNYQNEFRMRHKDGTYRWILAQASIHMDETGRPIRMTGSHIDITQRKQVEEQIQGERDFSEHALNSLPGVFYMYDEERKFLRWNQNFEKVTGYSAQEIAHMRPLDFFAGEEKKLLAERIQEVFSAGVSQVEADFVSKDGARTPYFFTGHSIQVDGKNCLVGVGIDISERKRAEEKFQTHRQLLETVVNYIPAAVSLLRGSDLRVQLINPAYQAIAPGKEMLGKTWDELWSETGQNFTAICRQVLDTGEPHHVVDELNMIQRTPNGAVEPAYFSWSLHRVRLPGNEGWGLLGTAWETTSRKQAEEEIHKLNAELELRVFERTAQLSIANKELESFSYSVSHDLRAPLRAINGFASIVARRHRADLNEEGQHYVDNIVQASDRMGLLIDDLLTYSRLGRSGVRLEKVSLSALLDQIAKEMKSRLDELNGTIHIEQNLPTIKGDGTLLGQIFTNLLENAMNYTKPGVPPQIEVNSQVHDDKVIIMVGDKGIGIPFEYREKIFNVFQRLHSEEAYPGTGIGLATVRKAVELLGGRIWVESTVGQGSTFFIELLME